jgi:hypothetical protein
MTPEATTSDQLRAPRNPYVGPFPFGPGQRLPNREREAQDLADLVISERVVLLHAPSGAGKTSLIQAAVLPKLTGFRVAGPARVDKPVPVDDRGRPYDVHNRYVLSIAFSLLGGEKRDPRELDRLTLAEVLKRTLPPASRGQLPLLVLDQLEEILTLDPTDWLVKEQFFQELGAVVADGVWALLAMREDYMGGLDRYLQFVPGHLRSRYRLDFLTHKEALAAIQKPARNQGVTVTDDAAWALVDKLARTKVQSPEHHVESKPSPYVEPFQLQVVCRRLWRDVHRAKRDFRTIEKVHVERHVDVERALSRYYADSIAEVVDTFQINERDVRDWFEHQLITAQGFRSQTTTGPVTGPHSEQILGRLTDMFLVNSDARGTTVWHELAHDRLIPAVRANNHAWRFEHLAAWQNAALEWQHSNRQKAFLLPPELLLTAPSSRKKDLADFEREFLEASQEEAGSRFRLRRYRAASTVLGLIVLIELLFILILLFK